MRFLRGNWAVAAAVLLLCQAMARAQDVELTNDYDQANQPAVEESLAEEYAPEVPIDAAPCQVCNGAGCPGCDAQLRNRAIADPCPRVGWLGFAGADSFRGVSDGTNQNNNGFVTGLNGAAPLPWLGAYGIGGQLGGSYGAYDLNGRSSNDPNDANPQFSNVQQQIFVTAGVFRRADADHRLSAGFAHDWMFNNLFGTYANSPTVSQWRVQVAYALGACNEIGLWGAIRDRSSTRNNVGAPGLTQTYQAIDQLNLFWHHKWQRFGGDSWLYVGMPDQRRLNQNPANAAPSGAGGSLGEFILGANWLVPISDCVSVYANTVYMKPSAHPGVASNGAIAATQEFWDISVGLAFYPQRAARSSTVAGRTWMPYMPLANNSNFFVDTNRVQ
jgi:hypothetical protein